ncbi:MAG: riboflavin biosynthesis protein RibF [Planctomycetota bacterium]
MRLFESLDAAKAAGFRSSVVTLGVFDGVHIGHRYVLRECLRLAAERGVESVVVTFVHHPRAVIAGKAPKLITSIGHRLRLFAELGIENVLALTFDDQIRETPADDFAHSVFEDILKAQVVVLGHNCRFGKNREGDAEYLIERAGEFAFKARHAKEVSIGRHIVSSTSIRRAILDGDLEAASSMLGRPFAIYGAVVKGDGRGRTIGFPTANLDLHHELRPPRGVYGTRVRLNDGQQFDALVNIGVRPTFKEAPPNDWEGRDRFETVEAHLLDFEGDLYGRDLEVTFLTHIREEMKFEGAEALTARIKQDRATFLAFLAGRHQSVDSSESPR